MEFLSAKQISIGKYMQRKSNKFSNQQDVHVN